VDRLFARRLLGVTDGGALRVRRSSEQNGAHPAQAVLDDLEGLLIDLEAVIADVGKDGEERENLVLAYLEALLSHRQAVCLLWRDPAQPRRESPVASRVLELNRELLDRVVGRASDLEGSVRFAVALGGTFAAVAIEARLPVEAVRELGIQANRAALGGGLPEDLTLPAEPGHAELDHVAGP
jgi:hypothetical protein